MSSNKKTPDVFKTETFTVKRVDKNGILIQTLDNQEFIFTIKEISNIHKFAHGKSINTIN